METRQIELEKHFTLSMKEQRERMEQIRIDMMKKNQIIQDQEKQIDFLKQQIESMQMLRNAFQELIQKSEDDMFSLRKATMEKEIFQKDLERMKEEINSRDEKIQRFRDDNDKLSALQRETEQTINNYKNLIEDKELETGDLVNELQAEIKIIKQENNQLKDEIQKLDETLFSLEYVKEQNQAYENDLRQERIKLAKCEKLIEDLKLDSKNMKKDAALQQSKLQSDCQKEVDNLVQKLSKFEQQSQDQRSKRKEEQKQNQRLKEDSTTQIQEIQRQKGLIKYQFTINTLKRELNDQKKQFEEILRDQEKIIKQIQQDNRELTMELKRIELKEQNERKVKSEIEKVRQDLMSVRNSEVQRMNEIFDGFLTGGHSSEKQFSGSKEMKRF